VTVPVTSPGTTPAPAAQASLWEDLIDIFYAPSQVYDRRRDGRFGLALVAVMLLSALFVGLFWGVLQPMFEATVDMTLRQAAAKGQPMPEEAAKAARSFGGTMGGIMSVVSVPIGILLTSFGVWVFGKLLDAPTTYSQSMAIVTLAQVPRTLSWLAVGIQGMLGSPDKPIFSYLVAPTRFMDPETTSHTVLGLLSRFDLFIIWATVLIAIGVSVIARVPRAKGAMIAAAVWLIAGSLALLQAGN
jgi:hypothetical protein